jgi:hypothetical protein
MRPRGFSSAYAALSAAGDDPRAHGWQPDDVRLVGTRFGLSGTRSAGGPPDAGLQGSEQTSNAERHRLYLHHIPPGRGAQIINLAGCDPAEPLTSPSRRSQPQPRRPASRSRTPSRPEHGSHRRSAKIMKSPNVDGSDRSPSRSGDAGRDQAPVPVRRGDARPDDRAEPVLRQHGYPSELVDIPTT